MLNAFLTVGPDNYALKLEPGGQGWVATLDLYDGFGAPAEADDVDGPAWVTGTHETPEGATEAAFNAARKWGHPRSFGANQP